jgi:hypothetical protein
MAEMTEMTAPAGVPVSIRAGDGPEWLIGSFMPRLTFKSGGQVEVDVLGPLAAFLRKVADEIERPDDEQERTE